MILFSILKSAQLFFHDKYITACYDPIEKRIQQKILTTIMLQNTGLTTGGALEKGTASNTS